jgi:hypothetical protein
MWLVRIFGRVTCAAAGCAHETDAATHKTAMQCHPRARCIFKAALIEEKSAGRFSALANVEVPGNRNVNRGAHAQAPRALLFSAARQATFPIDLCRMLEHEHGNWRLVVSCRRQLCPDFFGLYHLSASARRAVLRAFKRRFGI